MGNDVKRYPDNKEMTGTNNGQLAVRFASRSLWFDPMTGAGEVPYKIHRKLCKQLYIIVEQIIFKSSFEHFLN